MKKNVSFLTIAAILGVIAVSLPTIVYTGLVPNPPQCTS